MSRRLRAPASCAYSRLSSISRVRSLRTPRSARCSPIARSSAAQGSRLASWRNTVFWCGTAWLLLMSDASGNASDRVESRPRSLYSKNEPDRRGQDAALATDRCDQAIGTVDRLTVERDGLFSKALEDEPARAHLE